MNPRKTASWIARIFIFFGLVLFCLSFVVRNNLPNKEVISQQLYTEPEQIEIEPNTIQLLEDEYVAEVTRLYSYDISGLVVEEHTSDVWYDYAHAHDPFNTRDLCLMWGENISSGVYQKGEYSHGDFTCYYRFKTRSDFEQFSNEALSNNHLIPATEEIHEQIMQAQIGDQVRIKGFLSEYEIYLDNQSIGRRGTSITREDGGDRACETIYVTDFEILHNYQSTFQLARTTSYIAFGVGSIALIWLILLPLERKQMPIQHYQAKYAPEKKKPKV